MRTSADAARVDGDVLEGPPTTLEQGEAGSSPLEGDVTIKGEKPSITPPAELSSRRAVVAMNLSIEVPEYRAGEGLGFAWDENFEIELTVRSTEVVIKANHAGLTSLARHLLTLAQVGVHEGSHIHLTADQEIESDFDLILERMEKG
ncbi:hypothetical protein ACGFNP_55275 [Nonomuraea sp. NPDC049269]|uniref:Imm32 family immunity protein n=1 Tax=Nonomuraea sp. NPDC049269 TaxID=3364349 RepID=UPI0037222FB0